MQDVDISINKRKIVEFNLTNKSLDKIQKIQKNIYTLITLETIVVVAILGLFILY